MPLVERPNPPGSSLGVATPVPPAFVAYSAVAVTPSDTAAISFYGLYIGVTGNVQVLTLNGQTTVFVAVPAGAILPIAGTKVFSTNTTASSIVAFS